MKDFIKLLKPLKKKITVNNLIYRLLQTLSVGAAIDFIILVAAKFIFIPNKIVICSVILALSVAVGLFLALVKYKVTYYKAAEEGDKLGCEERLITAYEILKDSDKETLMENLAVKDAVKIAKSCNPAAKYKITYPKKLAVITAIMLAASCLTGFAPDAGIYVQTPITEQALKEAEEVKKNINNDEKLSDSFKEEYNKILKNLNKNLKKAKDSKEAKKLINEAQKELKKLENKALEDKNNIKNIFSDLSKGNELSSAMDLNNSEALQKAMTELAKEISSMTDEELAKLAEQLSELAEKLNDEELKKALEEAEEAAKEGDTDKLNETLSSVAESALNKSMSASSSVNRTASSLAKASDGTGKTATSTPNSDGNASSQAGTTGQSGNEGQGASDGQGETGGNGSGQGEGNGQGEGAGSGNNGSGSGNGGNGRGFGHSEAEKVFTRNAENIAGEEQQLQSQQTDEGEVTYSETQSGGVNGQSVPYDKVVVDYKNQALKETENGNIPYGMKEVIAEYFSGLEK